MKTAYSLVVLSLSILLFGCTIPQQAVPGGEQAKYVCADGKTIVTDVASCPAVAATASQAQPALELSLEEELTVCAGMPVIESSQSYQSYSFEDVCITGLAGKHQNTSLCRKVSSDQRKTCYALVAEVTNDPDVCAEAGAGKNQCLEQYARDKTDASACEKMTDVNYKDACYSSLANSLADPTLCEQIRNVNQKDGCYSNMASRLGDSTYCNKITNANQKQNCQQNIQGGGGAKPAMPTEQPAQ